MSNRTSSSASVRLALDTDWTEHDDVLAELAALRAEIAQLRTDLANGITTRSLAIVDENGHAWLRGDVDSAGEWAAWRVEHPDNALDLSISMGVTSEDAPTAYMSGHSGSSTRTIEVG